MNMLNVRPDFSFLGNRWNLFEFQGIHPSRPGISSLRGGDSDVHSKQTLQIFFHLIKKTQSNREPMYISCRLPRALCCASHMFETLSQ
jgi:hypothetical protein